MRVMKRKTVLVFAVAALMLAVAAGVAWAANTISCDNIPDNEPCMGTDQDDQMIGDRRPNTILALAGNDGIHGGEGDDLLNGAAGNDNPISGFKGNDELLGGRGGDRLWDTSGPQDGASPDVDSVRSGRGKDFIDVRDGDTQDRVDCGKGRRDRVHYDRGDTILRNCEYRVN
jgi:hypothetical protein